MMIHTLGKLHQHAGLPGQDLVQFDHFLFTKEVQSKATKKNKTTFLAACLIKKVVQSSLPIVDCTCVA